MHADSHLAYAELGITPPPVDYHLFDQLTPGENKKIYKGGLLAMFGAPGEESARKGIQQLINVDPVLHKALSELGIGAAEVMLLLQARHTTIQRFFCSSAWQWLMRRESDICTEVNVRVHEYRACLSVHDSWLSEDPELLETVIGEVCEKHTGFHPEIH